MTRDEIVEIARRWVRERYAMVPPVAGTMHFTDEGVEASFPLLNRASLPRRLSYRDHPELSGTTELMGKWVVHFFCSWDTDKVGIPETLHLCVDDLTGEVEPG